MLSNPAIAMVLASERLSKIYENIVIGVDVMVIDIAIRPHSFHVKPCQPMRGESRSININPASALY